MKMKKTITVITIAVIAVSLYMKFFADNEYRFINKKPEGFSDSQWYKMKYGIKQMWLNVKDIDYHCVVLDQFQQPVEGAEVIFEISRVTKDVSKILRSIYVGGSKEKQIVKITSDDKGIAHLAGVRGDSFRLKSIIKPGFSYVPSNENYSFEIGRRRPQSSFDEPVKVYLIENATSEPLFKKSFYKRIKYNDTWEIDLLRRNKKGPTPDQVNLLISCRPLKEQYDIRDCELSVEPPPGIEIAPASRHSYLVDGLSPNKLILKYEGRGYKKQYFMFYHDVNEDFYSKIMIDVTGIKTEPRIRITSFSNPIKGSKALSYIKDKELKKWPGVIAPDKK